MPRRLSIQPVPSRCLSCRLQAMATLKEIAADAGLLALNPSDLVYSSSPDNGLQYYNSVLSCRIDEKYRTATLYLIEFNSRTAVQQMNSANISADLLDRYFSNRSEVSLVLVSLLLWIEKLRGRRLLILTRNWVPEETLDTIGRLIKRQEVQMHVQSIESQSECSGRASVQSMLQRLMLCDCQPSVVQVSEATLRTAQRLNKPRNLFHCCFCT